MSYTRLIGAVSHMADREPRRRERKRLRILVKNLCSLAEAEWALEKEDARGAQAEGRAPHPERTPS